MPLSSSGIASGQSVKSAEVLQFFNFLTGIMTDQVLTIANTINGTIFVATGLTGATQASRYVGATASGAPASGTFQLGDFIIDQSGAFWICTVAGTPGTWVSSGSVAGTAHAVLLVGNTGSGTQTVSGLGTSGQVLTSNGAAANPTWQAASAAGSAGGDLSGTYPNPTVAKIQARAVAATAPGDGQLLKWVNGSSNWAPGSQVQGGSLTTSGAGSGSVTFSPAFTNTPNVVCTYSANPGGGASIFTSSITTSGFSVTTINSSDAGFSGSVNWVAVAA